MKIEELPSGSYRIRKMVNGLNIRITFDHYPDDLEIALALAEKSHVVTAEAGQTYFEAANAYIKSKENVLSPTTIRAYQSIIKNTSDGFKRMKIRDISPITVQKEVNDYSSTHSAKSTKNYNGFIVSVLTVFRPDMILRITLPKRDNKREILPSSEDVRALLDEVKGTEYSIPFQLGALGLRRSEVCALTIFDLKDNKLTINKAKIKDLNNNWIIKPFTKTEGSTRTIYLPDSLVAEIRKKGYIYNGSPDTLGRRLHTIQDRIGLPRFKLHSMRHFFVSFSHAKGIPDAYITQMGGWASDSDVMRKVYREAMEEEKYEMQKKIGSMII